jgi:hypothetical protein
VSKPRSLPDNPVTPSAREAFVLYLREWQEKLGLQDWRIHVSSKSTSVCADVVKQDLEARLATVRVGKHFGDEQVDDETIEDAAVHELCHVLLYELIETALERRVVDEQVRSAEHRVIHTLVNLLVHDRGSR